MSKKAKRTTKLKDAQFCLWANADDVKRWREAASADDISLSQWIRQVCNRGANPRG